MNKSLLCLTLALALSTTAQAFYDPLAGRWLSRDPIAESGGTNLYGFVRNSAVGNIDKLGRDIYFVEGNTAVPWNPLQQALHIEICVDTWEGPIDQKPTTGAETCCCGGKWYEMNSWRKCISFGAVLNPLYPEFWQDLGQGCTPFLDPNVLTGVVYTYQNFDKLPFTESRKTTCWKDMAIGAYMDALSGHTYPYGPSNNCRGFSRALWKQLNKMLDEDRFGSEEDCRSGFLPIPSSCDMSWLPKDV